VITTKHVPQVRTQLGKLPSFTPIEITMSLQEQWWVVLLKNNPRQHSLMKKTPEKHEVHGDKLKVKTILLGIVNWSRLFYGVS
jgi:phosphoglycerate-specific signal transduction histidine kinase